MGCLEDMIPPQENVASPHVEVIILDGAAITNMLAPGGAKTFCEYATQVFMQYITSQLQHAIRVDVVWDEYMRDSLKADTPTKRGRGIRRRVEPSSSIPGNWQAFLRINENKVELLSFLATTLAVQETEKQVINTLHKDVVCTHARDIAGLAPCTHEEADTRMLLHVEDATKQGYTKVSIRTVGTDVVVLAVAAAQRLSIDELWVAFGTGKSFRFLAAHEMAQALGPDKCRGLPAFHAFTGCDTVSSFGGRSKNTAWETWKVCDEVTAIFYALGATPTPSIVDDSLDTLEHFVVLLYDRTSNHEHVNDARKQLFTQKGRAIDALPPTREALGPHIRRTADQADYCWGQMMVVAAELPSPSEWGWMKSDTGWDVCWTTLTEATKSCRQLLRCGCKKGCRGQWKCRKAVLQCAALFHCGGHCARE